MGSETTYKRTTERRRTRPRTLRAAGAQRKRARCSGMCVARATAARYAVRASARAITRGWLPHFPVVKVHLLTLGLLLKPCCVYLGIGVSHMNVHVSRVISL